MQSTVSSPVSGPSRLRPPVLLAALGCALALGCATTRSTDTPRTATEQLLLSTAIDKAINRLDFGALAEKRVFFDTQFLQGVTDEKYVTSALRQHLLASGCALCDKRDESEIVLEARSGGVGTDRNELMLGLPAMPVPGVPGVPMPLPAAVPQMTLARNTKQRAVAKLAVFAYNRETGRPIWQSGTVPMVADAKETWVLGVRPFQRRTLINGKTREGELLLDDGDKKVAQRRLRTNEELFFNDQRAMAGGEPPHNAPGENPMPNQGATIETTAGPLDGAAPSSAAAPPSAGPEQAKPPLVWRRAQSPAGLLWWFW